MRPAASVARDGTNCHRKRAAGLWGTLASVAEGRAADSVNGNGRGHDFATVDNWLVSTGEVIGERGNDKIHGPRPGELFEVSRL